MNTSNRRTRAAAMRAATPAAAAIALTMAITLAMVTTLAFTAGAARADVANTSAEANANASAADVSAGALLAPKAFRAAMQRVMPSVVRIETFGGAAPPGRAAGVKRPAVQGISRPGEGPTTGLIISPDGYIITSTFNFIRKPPIITVVLHDGSRRVARMLGRDETRGLALLKIEGATDLPVPAMVPADEVRVGQWAITVGVGYGDAEPALSAGIVSARNRIFGKAIQTDANISPANYGGPLLDIEGRVIGVCVPLSPRSAGGAGAGVQWYDSGIGFAVPLDGADELLARLKRGEVIEPGRIGVQPKPGPVGGGVAIAKVLDKSPAQKAELKEGDVIIAVNGQKIIDMLQLRSVLGRFTAGETITLGIKRGDETLDVPITLASGGGDVPEPKTPPLGPKPEPKKPRE